jgi:hypothetical protein
MKASAITTAAKSNARIMAIRFQGFDGFCVTTGVACWRNLAANELRARAARR